MGSEPLPAGWQWTTLGQVAAPGRSVVSGPFGSNIGSRFFVDSGVPVIRGNNLTTDMVRFVDDGFVFVTEQKAHELGNCEALPGDLIFTAAGSLGQVGLVPSDGHFSRYIISNKQLRVRLTTEAVDHLFAYYWFASPRMVEHVRQRNTGSSVPLINLGVLRALPMPLPPLREQREVVRHLGTLDDKIELNRRMSQTLESMARALFKSWFVDFDPVRAKAEGRDPAVPGHLGDLLTDSFEDSQLGEIPSGWRVASLRCLFPNDDECVLTGPFGTNLHAHDYRAEGVPLILVKHVVDGRILDDGLPLVGEHKARDLERYRLRLGDIVFTRVGAVGRSAYVQPRNVGWLMSGQTLRVRVRDWTVLHPRYLAQLFQEEAFTDMVEGHALGTTRPSLNTALLESFLFVTPPGELAQAFAERVSRLDMRIQELREESRLLACVRDTLLPKTISGEVRIGMWRGPG